MEDMHRTHKEPAWGWIGALLDARRAAAPADARDAKSARPGRIAPPRPVPPRRAPC